jgi:hypothetical protein
LDTDEFGNDYETISTRKAKYNVDEMEWGHTRNAGRTDTLTRYERISGNEVFTTFRNNVEKAQYHYFNENGAYRRHWDMMDTLRQYVSLRLINSGWLIAHSADYHTDHISRLAMQKRAGRWDVNYHVDSILKSVEDTYTAIGEVLLGERDAAGQPTVEEK